MYRGRDSRTHCRGDEGLRFAARKDLNQQAIVDALRAVGASVCVTNQRGLPDILCGFQGRTYLIEVKGKTGKLTTAQEQFIQKWRGPVSIVRSVEEALEVLGVQA